MASAPVDSPPDSSSSPPPPPSPDSSSSPPPNSSPPPPPQDSSSPPPDSSSPPPPPPPPPGAPPPKNSSPPPPPPEKSNSPPPPPPQDSKSPPPPPNSNNTAAGPTASPPPPFSPPPPPSSQFAPPPPRSKLSPPNEAAHKSPPPPHKSSPSDKSIPPPPSSSSKLPIIIGVVAGAALLLVVMAIFFCCCRKKKKRKNDQLQYYHEPPHDYKGADQYYSNWNNSPQNSKLPPPPGTIMGVQPGVGWPAPPPPPPNRMSGEISSGGFSGPFPTPLPPPHPSLALGFNKSTFSYDELAVATAGFSQGNLLGQGGFGYVHKGVLPNGKEIAVKSLKTGSGQGEREFQAEVEIISRVHHRHLVSLVGYCIAGGQRMLVYEFLPNSTLEYHLHGKDRPTMEWSTRMKIAMGSAKGLAYLHEDCHPRIIHRDIKAANILLDFNFDAKVADFGLAKLSSDTNTHVSTRIMGTFGYLAPEYASSGKLTEKSDVFSFGIMLLELITGRRPVEPELDDSLVDWARPLLLRALEEGKYEELVDPRLQKNYSSTEMVRVIACAAACIRHSSRRRPKMSQVVRALEGDVSLDDLNEGVKPGQSMVFSSDGGSGSTDYDINSYNADMKKFRRMALSSQDYESSTDYGFTSDYAHNEGSSSTASADSTDIGRHRTSASAAARRI